MRVLYRKTWEHERKEMRDRSTVGAYFAPAATTSLQALSLAPDYTAIATSGRLVFRRTLTDDLRAVAIYPHAGLASASVKVSALRPDGSRVELIAFHPRPDWTRRYWFRQTLSLPRGTRIEVDASFDDETPLLPLSAAPDGVRPDLSTLRLTLNVIPGR